MVTCARVKRNFGGKWRHAVKESLPLDRIIIVRDIAGVKDTGKVPVVFHLLINPANGTLECSGGLWNVCIYLKVTEDSDIGRIGIYDIVIFRPFRNRIGFRNISL